MTFYQLAFLTARADIISRSTRQSQDTRGLLLVLTSINTGGLAWMSCKIASGMARLRIADHQGRFTFRILLGTLGTIEAVPDLSMDRNIPQACDPSLLRGSKDNTVTASRRAVPTSYHRPECK